MSAEEIVFPCTHCKSPYHSVQAHGYYPFMGLTACPERYRAPRFDRVEANRVAVTWLAEDYILRLTPLEAGALRGFLHTAKENDPRVSSFMVRVRGRAGEIPMIDRLIEKVEEEVKRHEGDGI